jgi:hypothetical protein
MLYDILELSKISGADDGTVRSSEQTTESKGMLVCSV